MYRAVNYLGSSLDSPILKFYSMMPPLAPSVTFNLSLI